MNTALSAIADLIRRANSEQPPFPPTLVFEEGWMLRLVLDWFAKRSADSAAIDDPPHPLPFAPRAGWFSEARLASPFPPKSRGDGRGEGYTNADGAIGHIEIGGRGQADLALRADATQFIVVEAKMASGLSKGTANAPGYNQAARNVACMAKIVEVAERRPSDFKRLGFTVLAPRAQIDAGVFANEMDRESLARVVEERAETYDPGKLDWVETVFRPALEAMEIGCLAWEDVIAHIQAAEPAFGDDLAAFYARCLSFTKLTKAPPSA